MAQVQVLGPPLPSHTHWSKSRNFFESQFSHLLEMIIIIFTRKGILRIKEETDEVPSTDLA